MFVMKERFLIIHATSFPRDVGDCYVIAGAESQNRSLLIKLDALPETSPESLGHRELVSISRPS
jgi:hypothetical protein